jgi:hypothetical protein
MGTMKIGSITLVVLVFEFPWGYDGIFIVYLQQRNDVDISMAYNQQDVIQVTQDKATNTSNLILFMRPQEIRLMVPVLRKYAQLLR